MIKILGISILSFLTLNTTLNTTNELIISLSDFAENEFKLVEGKNYYEIYDSDNVFIEGSLSSSSPYYSINTEKYYLGPGNYYYAIDDCVYNIFTKEIIDFSKLNGLSYQLTDENEVANYNLNEKSLYVNSFVDANGFNVISNNEYFRRLKYFPQNWFGECGLVSISILLGYLDTFYNDDFIPNYLMYPSSFYKNPAQSNNVPNLDYKKNELLIKKVDSTNPNNGYYNFRKWLEMPGTNYSMRDYLFDNYLHTYMNLGNYELGFPMMDEELKATFKDYINDNCGHLMNDIEIRSGNMFFTHQRPKEYINEGIPTLLVLTNYQGENPNVNGNAHIVTAYGYKDDKFLVHFGWYPNSLSHTQVILNKATIYGFFAVKFNGVHKCSNNVSLLGTTKTMCGCGNVTYN